MSDAAPALALEHVAKHFGPVAALTDALLEVRPSTVHALLGENGAGKTTLMRIAFGLLAPDRGTVLVGGVRQRFGSPADAIDAGIAMVHQHFTIVSVMTVAENTALAAGRGSGGGLRYSAAAARARVREIASATGLVLDPDARAESLGVGAQQRLEIVKALARPTRVLILDEPTAVLAPAEADELLRWVREFASSGDGRAVVLITHKLREALAVADSVTVLRHGATVLSGRSADLSEAALVRAMIGSSVSPERGETRPLRRGDAVVRAHSLTVADAAGSKRITDATFEIARGEIVGIAGVEGAGHRELLRAIAGRLPARGGSLTIPERVGFVPEDRQRDALIPDMPLFENVALRDAGVRRGLLPWAEVRARTRTLLERFDVRAPEIGLPVSALSGGNQQRLVLARELDGPPPALVVESPTRGLDVRATAAVHDQLRAARDAGIAIALYSSDLDEMLLLADRVLVVFAGTVREVPRDRQSIGRAMVGVG